MPLTIDNRAGDGDGWCRMRRVRALLALFLAALWLPATQHCGLEAAEVLAGDCAGETGETGCATAERCAADSCASVEEAGYRAETRTLEIGAPVAVPCVCLTCLLRAAPAEPALVLTPPDPGQRPRDWVPSWVFVRRAAPPAHAPDSWNA